MEKGELYRRAFYACFVNGGKREESYPFAFHNEYELVEAAGAFGRIYEEYQKAGLKGEGFVHDKLELTGNQQIYYATVSIQGMREAGKLGEYGKWYRIEFDWKGKYPCSVRDYSALPEEMFREEVYRCNITIVSKEENDNLLELFKVYPDDRHIFKVEGKNQERMEPVGTLREGVPIDSIQVWHCQGGYYLCAEFCDANQLPIGLFDMGYHEFVFANYSDQNMPQGGNWGNRVPITVILSHFHKDHIDGLISMVNNHIAGQSWTYNYFFSNMDLHLPNTIQPPSFNTLIATVRNTGGNVVIHDDKLPMQAQNSAFSYGHASFNHPISGAYIAHPHLHGMYVRCQTTGGKSVLMVGDTVYRGIQTVGGAMNQMPHQGDLAVSYDVLIACHHGGDYAVDIAGHNYPQNVGRADYIPIPGNNPVVIYSANGNWRGAHPDPVVVADHQHQGWAAGVITNANYDFYGVIPDHIIINREIGFVKIT